MSFDSLGLNDQLLQAVAEKGYTEPSPIQAEAIPAVLSKQDVLAAAQTGTGKTAGFTLPILHMFAGSPPPKGKRPVRALILTPTRELAAQVGESVNTYGQHTDLRSAIVFGGVSINPQKTRLRHGVDILTATPGRLLDLHQQRCVDLSQVEIFVLDEADRMLDMGFIHDIRKILKLLPKERQNLLFSATFSNDIRKLAGTFLHNPVNIEVAARNTAAESVEQTYYRVTKKSKATLLKHIINEGDWNQVLIFSRTKHGANRLAKQLDRSGIKADAIHGNKSQNARTRALEDFKKEKVRALVATDIAARGLDIKQLPYVVNFDLPNVSEDYVHRIGRTGRAGESGIAVSLVGEDDAPLLKGIERLLGKKLDRVELPDGMEQATQADLADEKEHKRQTRQHSRSNNGGGGGNRRRRPGSPKAKGDVADASSESRTRRGPGNKSNKSRGPASQDDSRGNRSTRGSNRGKKPMALGIFSESSGGDSSSSSDSRPRRQGTSKANQQNRKRRGGNSANADNAGNSNRSSNDGTSANGNRSGASSAKSSAQGNRRRRPGGGSSRGKSTRGIWSD